MTRDAITLPSDANAKASTNSTRRPPIPRKGHTKSRLGCLTCKKRKVKCDEAMLQCGPCRRLGLECRFASRSDGSTDGHPWCTAMDEMEGYRSVGTKFSIQDMNFLQSFLLGAYPSLPIGGWEVWQDVGRMSHSYSFLLHAMLGLGASHLSLLTNDLYAKEALKHRILAIRGLNQHLAGDDLSQADGDAALAAILTLTSQCSYLEDGLIDLFCMVRGCIVVSTSVITDLDASTFKSITRNSYVASTQRLIGNSDKPDYVLDKTVAMAFSSSLKRLGPLCRNVTEIEYLATMQKIVTTAANTQANLGNRNEFYYEHSFLYDKLGVMSLDEFSSFTDRTNHASRMIILHLLALEIIMSRKELENGKQVRLNNTDHLRVYDCRKVMAIKWISKMAAGLPLEYRPYMAWLIQFVQTLSNSPDMQDRLWTAQSHE